MRNLLLLSTLLFISVLATAEDDLESVIKQLSSEEFAVRQAASLKLSERGIDALPRLIKALAKSKDDAELSKRIEALLEPPGLRLKSGAELVKEDKEFFDQVKKPIEQYLGGTESEQKVAEENLINGSPYMAVAVKASLAEEKDEAHRERLYQLIYKMLSDSAKRAEQILNFAKALHTCGSNLGPYATKWDAAEVLTVRSRAKTCYSFFVNPQFYRDAGVKEIAQGNHSHTPYRDLDAAGGLYELAQGMYERLAGKAKDETEKKELLKHADEASAAAAEARKLAKMVN